MVISWDFMGFDGILWDVLSGKPLHNYGKSPCLVGKVTNSVVIFNSYVTLQEGKHWKTIGKRWEHVFFFVILWDLPSGN